MRADSYVRKPEWWKHLRPFLKRLVWKRERKMARKNIKKEIEDK